LDLRSLGLGLSDEETLSAQLNEQLGPIVYNAAGTFSAGLSADYFIKIARESAMDKGWIVIEMLNRSTFFYMQPPIPHQRAPFSERLEFGVRQRWRAMGERVARIAAPVTSVMRRIQYPNAVTRVATLVNMRLHNGSILPNPLHDRYAEEQLVTGRKVLMSRNDTRFAQRLVKSEGTANAIVRLRDELERRGYHLAVILMPNGYSVYYPLLRNQEVPDYSEPYLHNLYTALSTARVPVLNLLPRLRQAAKDELTHRSRMIFYSDDAHWNPVGCSIAAHAVAPWLDALIRGAAVTVR